MPKFYCIHCGQPIDAVKEWAGKHVNCPSCAEAIVVPGREYTDPELPQKIPAFPDCATAMRKKAAAAESEIIKVLNNGIKKNCVFLFSVIVGIVLFDIVVGSVGGPLGHGVVMGFATAILMPAVTIVRLLRLKKEAMSSLR